MPALSSPGYPRDSHHATTSPPPTKPHSPTIYHSDLPTRPPHTVAHPGLAGGHGGGLDPVLPINGIAARPLGFSVGVTHIHCAYIVHRSVRLVAFIILHFT